jgi:hypothetical protein
MAITKWSIQAPSSKKSPVEAAAAALRKKSPAEAGPLPEDANIIPLASAKAKARTADTKDE